VPALAGNRLLYRDGVPVAARVVGKIVFLEGVEDDERERLRQALLRDRRLTAAAD